MAQPLRTVTAKAYPFGMKNCDTDVIIAAEWLKTISRTGLGKGAFAGLRASASTVFDDSAYQGAEILIAGDNFGCGSSREHAAWAIADMGVKVVIAPSFSDIFSGNAFKNGILTVVLPQEAIDRLMVVAKIDMIDVDLDSQTVTTPFQDRFTFEVDAFRKYCLMEGLDEVGLTMASDAAIGVYEQAVVQDRPWMVPNSVGASDRTGA